ncbi:hypothetical protein [Caniella muris]|uniref:hypothetical protein n=1 Tax=Caniella muris TaxID=2941502 RepID=UPI0020404DFA|nr:hypothetical protein [Caniella muris]
MKTLISERRVMEAAETGEAIAVGPCAIVTAQARDTAKRLGVALVPQGECGGDRRGGAPIPAPAAVAPSAPCAASPAEPALTAGEVERVCRLALENGVWSVQDIEAMAESLQVAP